VRRERETAKRTVVCISNAIQIERSDRTVSTASRISMLHVRVDDRLKTEAAERLSNAGLAISGAVRILLTRVAREGPLPAGLAIDPDAYDAWFRAKVQEALADARPATPHSKVMDEAQALIHKKRRARSRS
jgi:DNA-damage-inducible protein J